MELHMQTQELPLQKLRAELARLRARHDCGAVSPALYAVIRTLEIDIAWFEHRVRR